jgi:mono/diheme cytochrome c family protein
MRSIVLLALLTGCGGVKHATVPAGYELHLGDGRFEHRANTLGVSVEEAKARDLALSEEEPPETVDEHASVEAAAIWRDLCGACHGPNGDPEEAPSKQEVEPRDWTGMGPAMGFFFGGDGMRAGIYRRIRDGGDAEGRPSRMPAWGRQLSREQIWALVRHIEGF